MGLNAPTKTDAGMLTIGGVNNLTGNLQVNGGSLRFNVSVAPTLASGLMATVNGTGTLELAGSVSAFTGGSGGVNVNNSSTAAGGLFVSGANQVVGGVDGTGNVVINAGGELTANHIVQNALVIGGTMGSAATVTIAASNPSGNPLVASVRTSSAVATAIATGSRRLVGNRSATNTSFLNPTTIPPILPATQLIATSANNNSPMMSAVDSVQNSANRPKFIDSSTTVSAMGRPGFARPAIHRRPAIDAILEEGGIAATSVEVSVLDLLAADLWHRSSN